MWLFTWLYGRVFCSSFIVLMMFFITILWLVVGCLLAFALNRSGYALAFGLLALGVNLMVLILVKISLQNVALYFATLLCCCGLTYGVALAVIGIRTYVVLRRAEREKIERATCYTLPVRENTFIQERLNTVLQEQSERACAVSVSFAYIRRMAVQLKNEKLSLTERLEVEELTKLFALYTKKETFTSEDVNTLNDGFSRVLKLCAKHGVSAR